MTQFPRKKALRDLELLEDAKVFFSSFLMVFWKKYYWKFTK